MTVLIRRENDVSYFGIGKFFSILLDPKFADKRWIRHELYARGTFSVSKYAERKEIVDLTEIIVIFKNKLSTDANGYAIPIESTNSLGHTADISLIGYIIHRRLQLHQSRAAVRDVRVIVCQQF